MDELNKYRDELDLIDDKIFSLLQERFMVTKKVGIFKAKNNLPSFDPEREEEIFDRLKEKSENYQLNSEMIISIFELITFEVKEEHERIKLQMKTNQE